MGRITRRAFIGTGALAGLASTSVAAAPRERSGPAVAGSRIDLVSDGVGLLPGEYARLLASLSSRDGLEDEYGRGGAVTALERQFATLLGKEAAVFMPSGTLANHLAIRSLAGTRRRVVVQQVSHVYNDTGDCAQQLSGLTLLPLAPGRASFSWDEVRSELDRAAGGRVETGVGAISIETPIRRLHNAAFDFAEMTRISQQARAAGIGLHLDGARLFVEAAFTGRALTDYTQLFDTVYVSLWKCFNSGNGAILAGPRSMLEGMYHVRRMFGGAMHHAWPDAVVAGHYAEGYLQRMRAAVQVAEDTWKALSADPRFVIERVPDGTSSLKLTVKGTAAAGFRERLSRAGIVLPEASDGAFWLRVNETLARTSPRDLAGHFAAALDG